MMLLKNKKKFLVIIALLFLTTGCRKDDQYYIDLFMEEHSFVDKDNVSCHVEDYEKDQVKVTCNYVAASANCGFKYTQSGVMWDCTNQRNSVRTISEIYNKDGTKPESSNPVPNKNEDNDELIKKINFTKFRDVVNGDNYNIVYLSQPNCSYCTNFESKFFKVLEDNNLFSYELDISDLHLAQNNELLNLLKLYVDDSLGTPTIIIVGDGSVIGAQIGDVGEDVIISFLENYEFID